MHAINMKAPTAILAAALLFASHVAARTDLEGCTSSNTVAYGGASVLWYVPDTGEICAFLDCGGGMAPPKTTVPGCAAYSGTAEYSPSFLPGFGAEATATATATASAATATDEVVTLTGSSVFASSTEGGSATQTAASASATGMITTAPTTFTSSSVAAATDSASSKAASKVSSASNAAPSAASSAAGNGTMSVATGAAAMPTAGVKGVLGLVAGLVAGVAML
ncbi:Uu.00g103450.m01.CDS01 [Anthostomella pinea]|uniref:Uu.00g103450.m01.CDS01 n=1 Tax=Anthostomella pinea TaxID=933095 RepID=A0AAI8YFL3_9PEZI|nr:Uu.00g103450.m01.CDS01 [Anthostomella pinea]